VNVIIKFFATLFYDIHFDLKIMLLIEQLIKNSQFKDIDDTLIKKILDISSRY
jgi:hypothetical protein